ncbi:MAG: hypothetical protein H7Y38_06685 [Armatimonadetes bacterium]|nr:hypothetical protein [Armatimonadota bacterium]
MCYSNGMMATARQTQGIRRFGAVFLFAEAVGVVLWWAMLLLLPQTRPLFMARNAPDATLMAFGIADITLFAGAAGASAWGLWARRPWARMCLAVHAGAAGYAALYCWTLVALTGGDNRLGALLMTPSLVIPALLLRYVRDNE